MNRDKETQDSDPSRGPLLGSPGPLVRGRPDLMPPSKEGVVDQSDEMLEQPIYEIDQRAPSAPNNPTKDPVASSNPYSPDFKSEPERKPSVDADIDTEGG